MSQTIFKQLIDDNSSFLRSSHHTSNKCLIYRHNLDNSCCPVDGSLIDMSCICWTWLYRDCIYNRLQQWTETETNEPFELTVCFSLTVICFRQSFFRHSAPYFENPLENTTKSNIIQSYQSLTFPDLLGGHFADLILTWKIMKRALHLPFESHFVITYICHKPWCDEIGIRSRRETTEHWRMNIRRQFHIL